MPPPSNPTPPLLLLLFPMALKFSQLLFFFFLWLSLLLLLFREFRNFNSKFNAKQNIAINLMTYSSISNHKIHPLISRKVLASSFDFTPFLNHQHQRQQEEEQHHKKRSRPSSSPDMPERSHDEAAGDKENEIDPRYGVEKRRVPTGPNPLHH